MLSYNSFIKEIKHSEAYKKTGHWGEKASGCIIMSRDTKRFLLGYRSKDVNPPKLWGTFGGAIDDNYSPEENMIKELYEETKYKKQNTDEIIFLHEYRDRTFSYYTYLVVINEEFIPRLNWENEKAEWFDYNLWPFPMIEGLEKCLDDMKVQNILLEISK